MKDHLGSTRVTEASDGTVSEYITYDAYGAILKDAISGTENPTKEKFTGKEYDTSGFIGGGIAYGMHLDYFGRRYYDPEMGVWGSTDPAEEFWNTYSFCMGNPINLIDPLGLYTAAVTYIMDEVVIQGTATASQAAIAASIASIAVNIGTQLAVNSAMADATRTIPQPVITSHIEMDPFNVMGPVIDEGTLSQQMFDLAMRDEMVEGMGNAFGGGGLKVARGVVKGAASFEHAIQTFNKGPLTNVGRALTKHPNIINESGNILQKLGGSANVNKAGADALQNIMKNGTMTSKMTKAFGQVIEYKLPNGLGARFSAETGDFIGFLGRGL